VARPCIKTVSPRLRAIHRVGRNEIIIVQGPVGRMRSPLLHDAFIDLDEVLHKVNSYSALGAAWLYRRGVRSSFGQGVLKGFGRSFAPIGLKPHS